MLGCLSVWKFLKKVSLREILFSSFQSPPKGSVITENCSRITSIGGHLCFAEQFQGVDCQRKRCPYFLCNGLVGNPVGIATHYHKHLMLLLRKVGVFACWLFFLLFRQSSAWFSDTQSRPGADSRAFLCWYKLG